MKHVLEDRNMHELIKLTAMYSKSSMPTISYKKNDNVLISKNSHLVEVLISKNPDATDPYRIIITIDSRNLVRQWNIKQHTVNIYKLTLKSRVTAAAIDRDCKYLAVGSTTGHATVLNIRSGGVVFELPHGG